MSLPGGSASVTVNMSVPMAQSSLEKDFDFLQMVLDLMSSVEKAKNQKDELTRKVISFKTKMNHCKDILNKIPGLDHSPDEQEEFYNQALTELEKKKPKIVMEKVKLALEEKKEIAFEVTNPRKSYAGHTVYRLQLKTFKSTDVNPQYEFIGWKRFTDFKKLYKKLKASYHDLFEQSFPEFARGKYFGRFDESVIEERRQSALKLLMFAVLYPEMFAHPSFETFLNAGVSQITPYLQEAERLKQEEEAEEADYKSKDVESAAEIEGETNCSIDDEAALNECILDENSDAEENDVFISNADGRESWLLEARSICGDDLESLASEAAEDFPVTPRTSTSCDTSVLLSEPLNDNCSSLILDDITESDLEDEISEDISDLSRDELDQSIDNNQNISDSNKLAEYKLYEKFQVDEKMSKIIEKTIEEDDYVFQASVAMSNAIEQEEGGNMEAAFDMYKFGIGLLLRGVQTDDNAERREAVRRKTAQYLLRAEGLYKSNIKLATEVEEVTDLSSVCGDKKWRFRLSDVKVFGIIDNVMLVQKVFSDDVFVMKVLHKQGGEYKRTQTPKKRMKQPRNLYNCKFMTKLINCVETQTGVYLLLEHITGGKLWDYLNLPLFYTNYSLINDSSHSWNATDCKNYDDTDIINIPCHNYTKQGEDEIKCSKPSPKLTCKIKRSPSNTEGLTDGVARLWAAQIATAIMDLHLRGVVCRDLNPRNILIDCNGDIKLTYFSNVEGIDYPLDVNAVDYMYTSPEADGVFEPTHATDWWSYGALLFELLTGESLKTCHPKGITSRSIITLPKRVSDEACSLLAGLLKFDAKERLGAGSSGNEEIKSHPFFANIDWNKLK